MNILVINCSPVKNGATAEIANLVGQYAKEEKRWVLFQLLQQFWVC